MTRPFRSHLLQVELLAGPGAIEASSEHPLIEGRRRALVFAGQHVSRTPAFDRLIAALRGSGLDVATAMDVPSPATSAAVEALAARQARESFDLFVGIGGGSTLDTVKAVALLAARGGEVRDHAIARRGAGPAQRFHANPFVPIVAVPTTLSGSEANGNASIRDPARGERYSVVDPGLLAELVVLDPAVLAGSPRVLVLGSAFNALAHCIEGIYSTRHHPLADTQAIAAGRLLCSAIARGELDDEHCARLQIGSFMAGSLIREVYVGVHHAMCHALVSQCGLGHAQANGAMLPVTTDFNLRRLATTDPGRVREVAAALGEGTDTSPEALAGAIHARLLALQASSGVACTLTELGVTRDAIPALVAYTVKDRALDTNPVPLDEAELSALFARAFA